MITMKMNYVLLSCVLSSSIFAMDKEKDDKNKPLTSQQELKVSQDNKIDIEELRKMRERSELERRSELASNMYQRRAW
jgi:hypothetical protein